MPFLKPPPLRLSDPVRVVAPSGPFDRPSFEVGLNVLSGRYCPRLDAGLFAQQRYLAGSDERRLAELSSAFHDDSRAVFAARGGYGSLRLLSRLALDASPGKMLVGFSDVTALHLFLQCRGRVSVHGPVLTQLGKQPESVAQRLFHLLEQDFPAEALVGTDTYVPGIAEGTLLGGNLSVFTRLLGTPFLPDLAGAVLLLEDVGERPYRLDRMWTHLELAGVFKQVAGIVLGDFTGCEEKDAPYSCAEVLRELAQATGLPCAAGFPVGHGDLNLPVPLGVRVRLDAASRRLDFLESAVAPRGSNS